MSQIEPPARLIAPGELSRRSPSAILAFFAAHAETDGATNWHAVALVADARAQAAADEAEATAWTGVSVRLYRHLEAADPRFGAAYAQSGMWARARLIRRFGPSVHDGLRDIDMIRRWFFGHGPGAVEDALRDAGDVSRRMAAGAEAGESLPTLRRLRAIKNRLSVLEWIAEQLPADDPIRPWLEVRERLP